MRAGGEQCAHELVLPDGSVVGGEGLAIYGGAGWDDNTLCADLVEDLIQRAFAGETGAVMAMGQTGSGKSRIMGTECGRRCGERCSAQRSMAWEQIACPSR